jgi:hypothetical protein
MTPADSDPNREQERKAEAPDSAAEPPTRLRKAAAGMTEAQAWKGQQIAKGWRKLVDATQTEASITVTPIAGTVGSSHKRRSSGSVLLFSLHAVGGRACGRLVGRRICH